MFESKQNIYYTQKSVETKVFWLFTEKVWKKVQLRYKIGTIFLSLKKSVQILRLTEKACYMFT